MEISERGKEMLRDRFGERFRFELTDAEVG